MKYILFLNSPTSGGKGLVKLPSYVNLSVVSYQWARFWPKFNPLMSFFYHKNGTIQFSLWFYKNYMSRKNLVLQLWPKKFSANKIAISDHQYLWKESIDLLIFSHGDNHQEKVASETSTFGWVLRVVPLVQSDCMIRWSSISLERIKWSNFRKMAL